MQIRCECCGRTVTVAATGVLPERCPHCQRTPVPERLGKWRIERLLAAGGMGEVYLARHHELDSRVALKLLPPVPGADGQALRQRFRREARLTAAIDHPGVVRVLDCDDDGERSFLVLEFVAGRTLRSLLRDGPLPVARAVRLVLGIADVLAAAHRLGVVHRDLKPENVLVDDDDGVHVLDFGIAKALQDHEPLTRTGEILGTPEYMAPEQVLEAADAVDARTDVHALGVLLHELLTGRSPFHAQNLFAVLKLVESLQPPGPASLVPGVPPAVDALVRQCLHKEPAARPADAGAFASALRAALPATAAAAPAAGASSAPWLLVTLLLLAVGLLVRLPVAPPPAQPVAAAAPASGRAHGEDLLRRGAPVEALAELDAALQAGDTGAREPAAFAFVLAHSLLPAVLDLPAWLGAVDTARRDRLFGLGQDGPAPLPTTPRLQAMALLARGEGAAALALLQVPPGEALGETEATLLLLAARAAVPDREAVRQLAARVRPVSPGPAFALLAASLGEVADLRQALQALEDAAAPSGPDRWLLAMALAYLDAAHGDGRLERLRAAAEVAWLCGGGEPSVVQFVGMRLQLAGRPGARLAAAEAAQLLRLLGDGGVAAHPARAVATALLHVAAGDGQRAMADLGPLPVLPSLQAARRWRDAGADADAWAACLRARLGDPAALAMLRERTAEPLPQLALAVLAPGEATNWATALRGDFTVFELLPPLPDRAAPLPATALPASPEVATAAWLPLLRLVARRGLDPLPLLRQPALQPFALPPLQADYVREVQGGLERH